MTWTDEEVAVRMITVYRLIKSRDGQTIRGVTEEDVARRTSDPKQMDALRRRISNVSDFMQALCEHVALRANREDHASGHFWEQRFGSRLLEDEPAILVCGVYIDLNQIRAGEAASPEESTHTSAYDRIVGRQARANGDSSSRVLQDAWLCELTVDERAVSDTPSTRPNSPRRASDQGLLSVKLDDYLRLLDWSGRKVRGGRKGTIPADLAPILDRLEVNHTHWIDLVTQFDAHFGHIVGRAAKLASRAREVGRRWYRGQTRCAAAFG
jgi:hypothetical protein